MSQGDLEDNIKKLLGFLRKDPNHSFISEEIAQEIGISVESTKQAVDDLILNKFVDVMVNGDDGTPCVKINQFGNKKLNDLTGSSIPSPSQNTGSTFIVGGDLTFGNMNTIKSEIKNNSDNVTNSNNPTKSKIPKLQLIVTIVIGTVAIFGVYWAVIHTQDTNLDDELTKTPTDVNVVEKKNSLEHQRIINYYDKGRPFSISWTKCGLITDYNPNEKITGYRFIMVPKIIDVEGKDTLIQFNSNFLFSAKAMIKNSIYLRDLTVENPPLHLINFEGDSPITINMTKTFDEATKLNAISVSLTLEKTSIAPYSDITGENISSYSRDSTEIPVNNFVRISYDDGFKWVESGSTNETICEN